MKKKICIIVDHPSRDLDGCILLKVELEKLNFDVSLLSYYFKHEVFINKPNIIIFPHYREQFHQLIAIYKKCGIMVAILDTEGGFFPDAPGLEKYINTVQLSLSKIDLYFLWGNLHKEKLISKKSPEKNFFVSGHPRYDLLNYKYRSLFKEEKNNFNKCILFNTNFPEINPKFQSINKEIDNSIKYDGVSRNFINRYNTMRREQLNNFINVIDKISEYFADYLIKIRPHPFESFDPYMKIKKKKT